MTQISAQVGIHKSTTHRLLATLEKKRFVERHPSTGFYRLGLRLLQMAYLTLEHNDLYHLTTPFLSHLGEQYQENIHLAVLDETDVVFVNVLESKQRVKLAASLGQRLPAFATASGKAILAYLPEQNVQRILEQCMPKYTERTILSPEDFIKDMELTRQQGFSISEQEYEVEINAIAAPIFNSNNQPIASIAVAGPAYRLPIERMIDIGPQLVSIASEIAQEIEMARIPE